MISESTGGLACIANLRFGSKIATGFGSILRILTVSSVKAYLAFGQVASAIEEYTGPVATSAIYRDIDLAVGPIRERVREYTFSDNEATADLAIKDATALRQLITTGLARVTNPERHGFLGSIAKQTAFYTTSFEHLRAMNIEQAKLETEVLDTVGQQMTNRITAVVAAMTKAGNTDLLPVAIEGRRLSLMARLDVMRRPAGRARHHRHCHQQRRAQPGGE